MQTPRPEPTPTHALLLRALLTLLIVNNALRASFSPPPASPPNSAPLGEKVAEGRMRGQHPHSTLRPLTTSARPRTPQVRARHLPIHRAVSKSLRNHLIPVPRPNSRGERGRQGRPAHARALLAPLPFRRIAKAHPPVDGSPKIPRRRHNFSLPRPHSVAATPAPRDNSRFEFDSALPMRARFQVSHAEN